MFSKKQLNEKIDTLIGSESQITGDLVFSGGLHIEGSLIGEVTCKDDMSSILVINKGGQVTGDISVPSAIIDGTVHGNVYTTHNLRLEEHGFINGNVHYNSLEMEAGAKVNGNLIHDRENKSESPEDSAETSKVAEDLLKV